jgi:cytochrome c oxidase subunit III
MASFTPTVSIADPRTALGGNGGAPPIPFHGGGDGDDHARYLQMRLRRARLGMGVGIIGIVMVFVSFTSAYVVRQGMPSFDPRTNSLVHEWFPVPLPRLLLINTFVLLLSSVAMELARRQTARQVALVQAAAIPGVSLGEEKQIPWLALTALLGAIFLAGQWMVWRELAARGYYLATSASSSFVYLLTAVHGVHLLGGIVALLTAFAASLLRRPLDSQFVVQDVTGWYWHFMAILWVYILCLLEFVH